MLVLALHQRLHDVLDHFKVRVLVAIRLNKDLVGRLKEMINDANLTREKCQRVLRSV